jgi:hypothetical protein
MKSLSDPLIEKKILENFGVCLIGLTMSCVIDLFITVYYFKTSFIFYLQAFNQSNTMGHLAILQLGTSM